ncbi:hypothetical protein JR334_00930 [Clostridia bacterium]|nr:hypothetical protein JR334_00930 [Clostridia bacterium]
MATGKKDRGVQIPLQAWLTTQIVMDIDTILKTNPNITLKEYIDTQKEKTNVWNENPDFPIYNSGYFLMMAYAFLVVPKESIEKNSLEVFSDEIEKILEKMTIRTNVIQNGLNNCENIIRHLRNAISHVNIDIIEDDKLLFIDKNGKKTTFDGDMRINDFKAFLVEFYKTYHKKYCDNFIVDSN